MKKFILIDQTIISTGGHYLQYAKSVLDALNGLDYEPYLVVNKRYSGKIKMAFDALPIFTYTYWESLSGDPALKAERFYNDLKVTLKKMQPSKEDIIFIPTISEVELEGLMKLLQECMFDPIPSFHILFRRNIFTCRKHDYKYNLDTIKPFCDCLRKCEIFNRIGKLYLYTDTDALTEQYNYLSGCTFSTLPIPHTVHGMADLKVPQKPYRIVYLGDARNEKGYQHIPSIAHDLYPYYKKSGEYTFAVQSNFNIPGGETGIPESRAKLQDMDKEYMNLILSPLSPQEYESIFKNTDIMLILYDALCYYARSSGIFAEAMSAGIPSVIPADTWMSKQIYPSIYAYFRHQIEEFAEKTHSLPVEREGDSYYIEIQKPINKSCAIISMLIDWTEGSECVAVHVAQYGQGKAEKAHTVEYVEASSEENCYFAINFEPDAEYAEVRFVPISHLMLPQIEQVNISWLVSNISRIPCATISVIYNDSSEISDKIRELALHYMHYKKAAVDFSVSWSQFHNPGTLLDILFQNSSRIPVNLHETANPVEVSVIVPVYNKGSFLRECLNSILTQTINGLEVICVDDGSSDNSVDILRNYQTAFSNVQVYTQPNSGPGIARNLGFKHACGEFVAFMDADDYYPRDNVLETLCQAARQQHVKVVGGDMICGDAGVASYQDCGLVQFADYQDDNGYTRFIIEREILNKHNITFPGLRYYEDPVFFLQVLTTVEKFYYIPQPVYHYRIINGHSKMPAGCVDDFISGLQINLARAFEGGYWELYNKLVSRICYHAYSLLNALGKENTNQIITRYISLFHSIDGDYLRPDIYEGVYSQVKKVVDSLEQVPASRRVRAFCRLTFREMPKPKAYIERISPLRKLWRMAKYFHYRVTVDSRREIISNIEASRSMLSQIGSNLRDDLNASILSSQQEIKCLIQSNVQGWSEQIAEMHKNTDASISDLYGQFVRLEGWSEQIAQMHKNTDAMISDLRDQFVRPECNFNNVIKAQSMQIDQINSELRTLKAQLNEYSKYVNPELLLLRNSIPGRKRILLVGYYGAPNFGDEMMLESVLEEILPNDRIEVTVMLADNSIFDSNKYGRVTVIHFPKTVFDYNILASHFDGVIFGGGAHIDDSSYNQITPYCISYARSILEVAVAFIAQEKICICLGLSSNKDLTDKEYIKKLDNVIQNATYFSLRDTFSLEVIGKLNIETSRIQMILDIACANPVFSKIAWNNIEPDQPAMGIVWFCNEETLDSLTELIQELDKRMATGGLNEYIIKLIPFFEPNENDTRFYKKVYDSLTEHIRSHISIVPFHNSSEKMCMEFKSVKLMINMRYHAAVINGMLGNRGINISYDVHPHYYTKMNAVAEMFPGSYNIKYTQMDIQGLADKVIELIKLNQGSQLRVDKGKEAQRQLKGALSLI